MHELAIRDAVEGLSAYRLVVTHDVLELHARV